MPKSARSFRPDVAKRVLAILADGSPPFLTIAAQRASFPEKIVEGWVRYGSEEYADPDDAQTAFALEVRRIQAEYIAEKTSGLVAMESEDKNATERARRVTWILSCLSRNLFDLSRPPKEAPKGETAKPVGARTAKEVADDLANPDLQ